MLLILLRYLRWPLHPGRLWLTAPVLLGALAIAAGTALLWPFVDGYRPLKTVSIDIYGACMENAAFYITPLSTQRFLVVVLPLHEEVKPEQISAVLDVARAPFTPNPQTNPFMGGGNCARIDVSVSTPVGVHVEPVGAVLGNIVSISAAKSGFGLAPPVAAGYVNVMPHTARWVSAPNEILGRWNVNEYRLGSGTASPAFLQSSLARPDVNRQAWSYQSHAFIAAPQTMRVAESMVGGPIDFSENPKQVDLKIGLSGLAFVVNCPTCEGRGGWASRLALATSNYKDSNWSMLGEERDRTHNRIVAISREGLEAQPLAILHAARSPLLEHWVSEGAGKAEASTIDRMNAETTDAFEWRRAEMFRREQPVTILASLLLGLGVTLWVEAFIVLLHAMSHLPGANNRPEA